MARMTQMEKVISFMIRHGEITQRDGFNIGVYRLADVIFRMKKEGYIIRTVTRKVTNADGSKSYIAVYSFPPVDDGDDDDMMLPYEK